MGGCKGVREVLKAHVTIGSVHFINMAMQY